MRNFTCHHCGYVSWAVEGGTCKSCGAPQGSGPATGRGPSAAYDFSQAGPGRKRGMAVASLILGVISLPTLGLLLVGALTSLLLGIAALRNASQRPAEYGGKGLAIGGIVTSVLSLLIAPVIGIVAAIAIPNLLAAARAANEASAINSIRQIAGAEASYQATSGAGGYGDLRQLAARGLVDEQTGRGLKNGYVIQVFSFGDEYEVVATPLKYGSSGRRSFYFSSEDAVLRAEDKRGAPAGAQSPELGVGQAAAPLFEAAPGSRGARPPGSSVPQFQ